MRRSKIAAILGACSLAIVGSALAMPGDPDVTFGSGGLVLTTAGNNVQPYGALTRYPDGRLLVANLFENYPAPSLGFVVARYLPDGDLDPSFASDGIAITDTPGTDWARAAVIQPDGKAIVAGGGATLVRYAIDGSLDGSFGVGGVATPVGGPNLLALGLLPDGRIVGAGGLLAGSVKVARYLSNGNLDPTFGSGGVVGADLGSFSYATTLVVQPDGRIVVSGYFNGGTPALIRFDTDGALDPTFGTGGIAPINVANAGNIWSLARQADGKFVAVGDVDGGSSALIARLDASGAVDPSFAGSGGLAIPGIDAFHGVAVQSDGKIVVGGGGVWRFLPNGTADASFGSGGYQANGGRGPIVIEPDGKIVTAGSGGTIAGPPRLAVSRLLGGTCGDGIQDGGEECDDGNVMGGDGCDAHCCSVDIDADGACDAVDPCIGPVPLAANSKIVFRSRTTLKMEFQTAHPFAPSLDPVANGLRLILKSPGRQAFDLTIPGGAYVAAATGGWRPNGVVPPNRWKYRGPTDVDLIGLVQKVLVQDRSTVAPGLVRVVAKLRPVGGYLPATATIILSPQSTAQCGEGVFATYGGPPLP